MTPMKAIKAYCHSCIVDPLDKGTSIQQIENCTDSDCALHEYRPLTSATKQKIKEKRINNMDPMQRAHYEKQSKLARERLQKYKNLD